MKRSEGEGGAGAALWAKYPFYQGHNREPAGLVGGGNVKTLEGGSENALVLEGTVILILSLNFVIRCRSFLTVPLFFLSWKSTLLKLSCIIPKAFCLQNFFPECGCELFFFYFYDYKR